MKNEIDPQGHIYFLVGHRSELIKIGYAGDLDARISAVRCHSSESLILLGAMECEQPKLREREIHDRFAVHRVRGEWFRPEIPLLEFIADNTVFIYDDHWEPTRAGNAVEFGRGHT